MLDGKLEYYVLSMYFYQKKKRKKGFKYAFLYYIARNQILYRLIL